MKSVLIRTNTWKTVPGVPKEIHQRIIDYILRDNVFSFVEIIDDAIIHPTYEVWIGNYYARSGLEPPNEGSIS